MTGVTFFGLVILSKHCSQTYVGHVEVLNVITVLNVIKS